MALEWRDIGTDYSDLKLPIGRLNIDAVKEWNRDKSMFASIKVVVGYSITLEDGGEGHVFASKQVPVMPMNELKQEAIKFLREQWQKTLEIIGE